MIPPPTKKLVFVLVLNDFGGDTRSVGYSRHRFLQNVMFSFFFFFLNNNLESAFKHVH